MHVGRTLLSAEQSPAHIRLVDVTLRLIGLRPIFTVAEQVLL